MMCVVRRIALAFLLVAALAGCGGEVDLATTPAGSAEVLFLEDLYGGRFEQAYAALNPAHQELVSQSLFARCARQTIPVGKLDSVEVLDVSDETVRIPALGERQTKAVRVRITSDSGETDTFDDHQLKAGDRWTWVLNDSAVSAYSAGRCPAGA
jgi:uncharacterized membrane protein YtjA (UPF0391 family)